VSLDLLTEVRKISFLKKYNNIPYKRKYKRELKLTGVVTAYLKYILVNKHHP